MNFQTTNVFDRISQAYLDGKRLIINEGGTSSSKTISTIQFLIFVATYSKEPLLISIVSESFPHLRRGCIRDFQNIMGKDFSDDKWNKSESIYDFGNGCKIEFFSADNSSKLRGGRRDILFENEANNLSKESHDELDVRTRKLTILDFNPVSEFWAHSEIGRPHVAHLHSTFIDAAHVLEQSVIDNILSRKDRDPAWWRVYGLGLVGKIEGLIHPNFQQCDSMPEGGREIYGLDFGYSMDPACLVRNRVVDDTIYSQELIYEKGLTNDMLCKRMDQLGVRRGYDVIIADSAEPKSIEEIRSYGFDIRAAVKGPDSVNSGIQKVNQYKQVLTKDSLNLIKEQRNYRWEKTSDGKFTNKPIDDFSHGMDARRYAIATIPASKVISTRIETSEYKISFSQLSQGTALILSLWVDKDSKTSVMFSMWSAQSGKLYVFAEHVFESAQPEVIIGTLSKIISIVSGNEITTLKFFELWGNDLFFGEWGGDLQSVFGKLKLFVRQNLNFNEIGAKALTIGLLNKGNIKLHVRCEETIRQLSTWTVDKQNEGNGLARALLTIASTLQESGKLDKKVAPTNDYSRQKEKARKNTERLVAQALSGKKPETAGKNSWMI